MSALHLPFVLDQLEKTLADFDTAAMLARTRLEVLVGIVKDATSVTPDFPDLALRDPPPAPYDPAPCRDAEGSPSTLPAEPEAAAESTEDPKPPAEEGAQPAAPRTAKPKGQGAHLRRPGKWTEARKAELRRLWFVVPRLPNNAIAEALNAMPGDTIHRDHVTAYGNAALKLPTRGSAAWLEELARRSAEARDIPAGPHAETESTPPTAKASMAEPQMPEAAGAAAAGAGRESRSAAAPEAVAGASGATPRTPPAAPQNPQELEAKQLLRQGWLVREVHKDFGGTIPMSSLSLWALQVRQEKEGKA